MSMRGLKGCPHWGSRGKTVCGWVFVAQPRPVRCRNPGCRAEARSPEAWNRRAMPPATAQILDLIQSCLEMAGVGEVILDEQTARAFLAEHRGVKAVTG